jgi:serine/threonine protein phosphatase PrpC
MMNHSSIRRSGRAYLDQEMTAPEVLHLSSGIACVFSARCPGKQTPNEDAAAVFPIDEHSCVLAVADGLGGNAAGEQAAKIAIDSIQLAIETGLDGDAMLRTAIINGIERANTTIQELARGAATTIAVVEVSSGTIRPYHVGDSMILVVGGRGKIKFQSVSHSPVGYGVEAGLLDENEAMHHDERHVVSNVLGRPDMHIAIGPHLKLATRDTLLLASDGLFDNLFVDRIAETIRKGDLLAATTALARDSTERMSAYDDNQASKPDDLTFIALRPGA